MHAFPDQSFVTIQADFVVKHPSQLPEQGDGLPEHIYRDAVDRLLSARRILTATDWEKSSNSKTFRPPSQADRAVLLKSIAAARTHFLETHLPGLIPEGAPCIIVSEQVEHVAFGCVSGRLKAIVFVGGFGALLVTTAAAATDSWGGNWFGRPNVSVSCSAQITGSEELAHHMRVQLRYENPDLLDNKNRECALLRQRVLADKGLYDGPIDGIIGNDTTRAEVDFAKSRDIPTDDLLTLYSLLSEEDKPKRSARRRR